MLSGRLRSRPRADRGLSLVEVTVSIVLVGTLGVGVLTSLTTAARASRVHQNTSDQQAALAAAADGLTGITPVACASAQASYQATAQARLSDLQLGRGWTPSMVTVTKVQSWNAASGTFAATCTSDSAVHKVTVAVSSPRTGTTRTIEVLTGSGSATTPIGTPWVFGSEFSLVAKGNVSIAGTQVYGALAVGGNLSFTSSGPIAANSVGVYGPVLGTTSKVGLLVGGRINLSSGSLLVNNGASAVVGDLTGQKFLPSGGASCIVASSQSSCVDPRVTLQGGTGNAVQGSPYDFTAAYDAFGKASTAMAALPGTCASATAVTVLDQNGVGPWSGSGNFQLTFTPNVTNVWNMTLAQLQSWSSSNNNGAQRPNATTPLIINVTTAGAINFTAPGWIQNDDARFVLWNFPNATSLTFTNALWGTLYAPNAAVTLTSDVRGVVVAGSVVGQSGVTDWSKRPVIDIACSRPA